MGAVATKGNAGELLREWRNRRRMSQLDLALEAGISARHAESASSSASSAANTTPWPPARTALATLAAKRRMSVCGDVMS